MFQHQKGKVAKEHLASRLSRRRETAAHGGSSYGSTNELPGYGDPRTWGLQQTLGRVNYHELAQPYSCC
jgi:hypothetical protein